MPAQTVIKLRRGTASQWTTANPVLAAGEVGLETDTLRTKYGNGTSAWADLSYSVADASGTSSVDWTSVLNKPATFPPSAHTHVAADVTDIESYVDSRVQLVVDAAPAALDTLNELAAALGDDPNFATTVTTALGNKSDIGHTHIISDVANLQSELDGKAALAHTHAITDVTNLQTTLDTKKTEVTYQIAANNTLVAGGRYFVDTSTALTLTLPASPTAGDEIQIFDKTGTAGTNNITVDNNGLKINGVVDTLVIDVNGAVATMVYTGTDLGWRV